MDRIVQFIQFAPLIAFGVAARGGGDIVDRIYIAAGLALPVLVFQYWPGRHRGDPLLISTNLFFMLQAAVFLSDIAIVDQATRSLREAGYFIVLLVAGLVFVMVSPRGLLGVEAEPSLVRRYSLWLLGLIVVALGVSLTFRGHEVYAAFLPAVALFLTQRVLIHRAGKAA